MVWKVLPNAQFKVFLLLLWRKCLFAILFKKYFVKCSLRLVSAFRMLNFSKQDACFFSVFLTLHHYSQLCSWYFLIVTSIFPLRQKKARNSFSPFWYVKYIKNKFFFFLFFFFNFFTYVFHMCFFLISSTVLLSWLVDSDIVHFFPVTSINILFV